jgi:RNA polymerase sigma-70 factor, ECF subfamily
VSFALESASDAELLAAARAGDKPALETLLARHQEQIYRFGMKMCRDPEDAQDVLQETLLAMARGVRDFRGASSISTWLYTVARSFCIKKRRRGKFAPEETSLDSAPAPEAERLADPSRGPEDALAGKQVAQAIERAIRELDPMYREVLLLRDIEGLTAAEVAEILHITTQAVKSRLHRARIAVRDGVAPLLGVPSDAPKAPGMCPDVLTLYSQYMEDEISKDVCHEMEQHLANCPRCRGACDSLKRSLALCHAIGPATKVPDQVQHAVRRAVKDFLNTGKSGG